MIAVLSDTHSQDDPRLAGRAREAVETAELVLHAGDFVREPVLDGFEAEALEFVAVAGNVDDEQIQSRLPRVVTITVEDFTIAMTHAVDGGQTALAMFGRECGADLVISGHTHRPDYRWTGDVGLLNPGSHADPRGNRPAHAELRIGDERLEGALYDRDGTPFEHFEIRRENH